MARAARVVIVIEQVAADPPCGNRVAQRRGQPAGRRDAAHRHLIDQPLQCKDQIGMGGRAMGMGLLSSGSRPAGTASVAFQGPAARWNGTEAVP